MTTNVPPLIAIVGPTASGKSELAVVLAELLPGEIVNADSMQLYRGMDIGTAKPDVVERAAVGHHLYDIWDVTQEASVAEYQKRALRAVEEIRSRGRFPLLVGGSGLYVRAVVDRIEFPGTDPGVRAVLEAELAGQGAAVLHKRLSLVDPAAAAAILPSNGRRLVRALEVVEITGRPFSATLPTYDPDPGCVQLGLDHVDLDARIDRRVDRMWERGFVAEVQTLIPLGLRTGRTASRALGYQQILAYLDGEHSIEAARSGTAQATRRFARRQRSWFRRDPRVHWLADTARVEAAVEVIRGAAMDTLDP
ncbi:MAG TPA: tRNA (adenosine(37)-N6)-dimethylallyltransferase MiaA [Mycobacteriales bacterium]|jgi:tRNA dimethylallyltransferase|nr:tRNA (adenosine(37)-N6)-dimethylallyltransferase MiaA [Mycobacteriales bacterium]